MRASNPSISTGGREDREGRRAYLSTTYRRSSGRDTRDGRNRNVQTGWAPRSHRTSNEHADRLPEAQQCVLFRPLLDYPRVWHHFLDTLAWQSADRGTSNTRGGTQLGQLYRKRPQRKWDGLDLSRRQEEVAWYLR